MTESTDHPLAGLWKPNQIQRLYYGPSCVNKYLLDCLPAKSSKAFIITGSSLASKTPLIKQVEELLKDHHAGTFSKIGQHAPIKQLDEATDLVHNDSDIDTIISIGGGSPIDSAKAISHRLNEKQGKFLHHITVPTTLSAAECTFMAGYTNEKGTKTGVSAPQLAPHVVMYDPSFAVHTPPHLWMSTGLRALDHSMETLYHVSASEMPAKQMALQATATLFEYLPKYKADPKNEEVLTQLMLAAYASLGFIGLNLIGGLGLSHSMGYALGSPYGIPHGVTSCLTLGHVVKLKAQKPEDAAQTARALPFIGQSRSGDDKADAIKVGDAILKLVEDLGLKTSLKKYNVGEDQIPVITKTATKEESGPLYDGVSEIVKRLY